MTDLPQPGALIGGRYRVESMLGRGGMGAVFAAVNDATGGAVAIKWMLPDAARSSEAVARFMAEARVTGRIEHPNVVGVLDAGEDHGAPYLVMERLRGESLGARLKRGRLSVPDTLEVIIGACRGVAEAHGEGVIHRDLKPDNIFLCVGKDGSAREPKVVDFGIGKLFEGDIGAPTTQTGFALGTPSYMSPEQLNNPRGIDVRADVYSMGIVLYQCLTGQRPYRGKGLYELIQRVSAGHPTPIRELAPDVLPELEAIVLRAMSTQREYRQSSMTELATQLEAIREHVAVPTAQSALATYVSPPPVPTPTPISVPLTHAHSHPVSYPMTSVPNASHPVPPHYPSSGWQPAPMHDPASYAPVPHATPDRGRLVLGVLALAITLLVVGGGAIVLIVFVVRHEQRNGGTGSLSGGVARPDVELRFSGACRDIAFDGPLQVTSTDRMVSIATAQGPRGVLTLGTGNVTFPATLEQSSARYGEHYAYVCVGAGTGCHWQNLSLAFGTSAGNDPIHGRIVYRVFDTQRGIVDATFEHVGLQHRQTSTLCEVNGRVRTYGLTWGD